MSGLFVQTESPYQYILRRLAYPFVPREKKLNMVYKVYSGRVGGVFGDLITVEVDASSGLPGFEIIGLPGSEVKESKDRVKVALKNAGINLPAMRIVVNLSPADEHKCGSGFDLPMAISLLGVFGHLEHFESSETLCLGELSLDGKVTSVRGVLAIVKMAKDKGFKRVIIPKENEKEAGMIKGIEIVPVENLESLIAYFQMPKEEADRFMPPYVYSNEGRSLEDELKFYEENSDEPDFKDVYGQENVKRAAALAAAGFHHLLMSGPPGAGKSLIAKCIPGIMPKLSYDESLEVTTIYSVAGKLSEEMPFVIRRPFWSPHHSSSAQAICGGGSMARPGLCSLSHRGILFLDEMTEFKRETIDMLRQPLEDGKITISRAKQTFTYPAKFMLVGALNPCPCGFYPDRNKCRCSQNAIERYLSRLSGPILDRIDICVEVNRLEPKLLNGVRQQGLSSKEIQERVEACVNIQKKRYEKESFKFNSQIPAAKINTYIPLGKEETEFVYEAYEQMNLSMRSFYKILRVARTIADYEGEENVAIAHLAEASCYRFPEYMGG